MINCSGCGRFFDMTKRHAWKMVYGGAPIPTPDGEIYRCERCLEKLGPFTPQYGIRPEYSCGIYDAYFKTAPAVGEDVVERARINADNFNLILKECGIENSEYAAIQICEFIEGKRSL